MRSSRYNGNIRPRSPFAAASPYGEYDAYEDDDGLDDKVPHGPIPLEPRQRASLVVAIDDHLSEHGCDNTLRAAEAWARREQVPWERLREELEGRGGFCDCEVLLNVIPLPQE